jgi:hypothetical protein
MIGSSRDPTIHRVFEVYSMLLDHVDRCGQRLKKKKLEWKTALWDGLSEARDKLLEYYEKTESADIYGVAVLLDPVGKDKFFKKKIWKEDPKWESEYWVQFEDMFSRGYAQRSLANPRRIGIQGVERRQGLSLDDIMPRMYTDAEDESQDMQPDDASVEFADYRQFGKSNLWSYFMVVGYN